MTIASLLFGGAQRRATVGSMQIDVTLEESYSFNNEVTMNPTEVGLPTSDFVRPVPDTITLKGLASKAALPDVLEGGLYVIYETGEVIGDAFRKLMELRDSQEPITVVASLKTYTNMIVKSIDIPRTPNVGDAIEYTIELVQIRRVSSKTTEIPPGMSSTGNASSSVGGASKPTQNVGLQQPKPYVPNPNSTNLRPESFLHGLFKP